MNDDLPVMVRDSLSRMSDAQRLMFQDEFSRRKHSTTNLVLLAIFLPAIYFIVLKRWGLAVLFVFTWGGGAIWWIVEWFLASGRTREANREVATQIALELKMLGSGSSVGAQPAASP